MTVKQPKEIIIYESPDGGKTIYYRIGGSIERHMMPGSYEKWACINWFRGVTIQNDK